VLGSRLRRGVRSVDIVITRSHVRTRWPRLVSVVLALTVALQVAPPRASAQQPNDRMSISPTTGRTGTVVTVRGGQADANCPLIVYFDGQEVARINPGGDGWVVDSEVSYDTYRTSFVVPSRPIAAYRVVVSQNVNVDGRPCTEFWGGDQTAYFSFSSPVLDPTFGPVGETVTVRGGYASMHCPLEVRFGGALVRTVQPRSPEWTTPSSFQTTFRVPRRHPTTYQVVLSQTTGCNEFWENQTASFSISSPILDPTWGPVGKTITVLAGYADQWCPLEVRFDGQLVRTVQARSSDWTSPSTLRTTFKVPSRPPDTYRVTLSQRTTCNEFWGDQYALFTVSTSPTAPPSPNTPPPRVDPPKQPAKRDPKTGTVVEPKPKKKPPPPILELESDLGPPGFVVTAVGRRFKPNTNILLAWNPGLGVTHVKSDRRGEFRVGVLILRLDRLGDRELEASLSSQPKVLAKDSFFVVPASSQPGKFTQRA
jgi:hypothetical protein